MLRAPMRSPLKIVPVLAAFIACTPAAPSGGKPAAASSKSWIERSNDNAQLLLEVQARFNPEGAARLGIPGIDERIIDFAPGHQARQREAVRAALAQLEERQKSETDPLVGQDLAILIDAAQRQIRGSELFEKLTVPYAAVPRLVFRSLRSLLDPQIAEARRPAALVRVRKYAGLEPGTASMVQLAEPETREGFAKGLLAPSRLEVQ